MLVATRAESRCTAIIVAVMQGPNLWASGPAQIARPAREKIGDAYLYVARINRGPGREI